MNKTQITGVAARKDLCRDDSYVSPSWCGSFPVCATEFFQEEELEMERTKFQQFCALFLALTFLIPFGIIGVAASEEGSSSVTDKTIADVREQLNAISYEEYIAEHGEVPRGAKPIVIKGVDYNKDDTNAAVKVDTYDGVEALYFPDSGTVVWDVDFDTTAKYSVLVRYYPVEGKTTSIQRIFRIDGKIPFAESRYITMPKVWRNVYEDGEILLGKKDSAEEYLAAAKSIGIEARAETREDGTYIIYSMPDYWTVDISKLVDEKLIRFFRIDIDNNELRNPMVQSPVWCDLELKDIDGFYAESFEFAFTAGKHQISLEAVSEAVAIESITLIPHKSPISYDEYLAKYAGESKGSGKIKIEAEFPSASSTQTVYPIEDRVSAATSPTDVNRMVLNTIGGDKWQTSGQYLEYKFKTDASGMYNIVLRFKQSVLDGIFTSRVLYIYSEGLNEGDKGYYNGIPFTEATELLFNYSTEWQATSLRYAIKGVDKDGNEVTEYRDVEFYFEEGVTYTIRFEVALGAMGDVVRRLSDSLDKINNDYLSILKLTGANPDPYRDYGFYRIMPDTIIDLNVQAKKLQSIADQLSKMAGIKSASVGTLEKIVWLLDRMYREESEIARNLSQLKTYLGTLGTLLSDAKTQPLQLDYILVQPAGDPLPKAKANFFESFIHEISSFFVSFFRNYNRMGATVSEDELEDALEVWMTTGRDQSQVVRNLINNDFTPNFGHPVNLKLVAGNTLLPSILAKSGPDVFIGLGEDNVINYAIRGALLNIENYEGFYDIALNEETRQFNEAAMMVLGIEDADGVKHYYGLPEDQKFPMMFVRTDILADLDIDIPKTWDDILEAVPVLQANNMQVGLSTDYKIFLYQMGSTLFADDGMRINLDSNTALDSFQMMCNMFTMYSFPYKYDFANRFRTGEMPIGIASYTDTYNKLVVYATEIRGLWQFVPLPGIVDANGKINNVSVSTVSAIVMITGCENEEAAWDFMKWHTGEECQSNYANEMVAILGDSAKHSTANIKAMKSLPWTTEEFRNVELQFNNLASIPNYPGSYIIGRYTQFAFLDAYNTKKRKEPTAELLSYIKIINTEISKKRKEFGLETLEIGQTKASKRMGQVNDLLASITSSSDYNSSYDVLITSIKQALRSEEAAAMLVAASNVRELVSKLDPSGSTVQNEIAAIKAREGCYTYDVYKYASDIATRFYFVAQFLEDAGNAINSYVD